MPNTKISALTPATTPLAGTEVLPIVQSGATVKVANNDLRPRQIQSNATSGILQIVGPAAGTTRTMTTPDANFTAARTDAAQSFTGDQTLSAGNLVQGTAAKGINFTANTPAAGMTSQLLNWYEEGTWTPTDASGASLTFTSASGKYTRMGNIIVAIWTVTYPTTANTSAAVIGGLPFTSAASGVTGQTIPGYNTANIAIVGNVDVFTKNIRLQNQNFSTNITNNQMSGARFDGTTIYTVTA